MKIVRIDGGLGNQMFCYAFALALKAATGQEVLIDSHRYKFFPNHNGYELDRLFDVTLKEATTCQLWKVTYPAQSELVSRIFQRFPRRKSEIKENYVKCYPDIFDQGRDGYYIGNWQWPGYFESIRATILRQFEFKEPLDTRNQELYQSLAEDRGAVSLHVRRGDYLTTAQYCNICDLEYYRRAIEIAKKCIGEKGHFVVFSNDVQWCIANICPLMGNAKITVVDWNTGIDSHKDMRLMSACRVNIIANSSFSWWGAYLNQRKDRIVISPDKWINLPLEYRVQCEDWICI